MSTSWRRTHRRTAGTTQKAYGFRHSAPPRYHQNVALTVPASASNTSTAHSLHACSYRFKCKSITRLSVCLCVCIFACPPTTAHSRQNVANLILRNTRCLRNAPEAPPPGGKAKQMQILKPKMPTHTHTHTHVLIVN